MTSVQYHLQNPSYSLSFVNPDQDVIKERLSKYNEDTLTQTKEYTSLTPTMYAIYSASEQEQSQTHAPDLTYDSEIIHQMQPEHRILTIRLLRLFERITSYQNIQVHKQIEIDGFETAFNRVDWSGDTAETAGRLMSNLIMRHSLPNANHRSSIGFMLLYLTVASDDEFSLPDNWESIVDDFIVDSKKIVTVRRNSAIFKHLHQAGCQTIQRKGNIDINLADYDLEMPISQALEEYAHIHEERGTQLASDLIQTHDSEFTSLDLSEFTDHLQKLS